MEFIEIFILIILILILFAIILVIFRKAVLNYFKINTMIEKQQEMINLLEKINENLNRK